MLTLGIETSCDDTAVAVLDDGSRVLSNLVSSQEVHGRFGGVVPEIASRMHMKLLTAMVREALAQAGVSISDLGGVAVTRGPGLIGSLLVGVSFAKALAYGLGIPVVGVNHVEAHLWSFSLSGRRIRSPWVGMVVSGGHTDIFRVDGFGEYAWLGSTRDDAAGEAFDKVAKLLGLGYPGGAELEELARKGNPDAVRFPRAYLEPESFDFSFSGLKTAVKDYLVKHIETAPADVAASFQAAVVEVLVEKLFRAARVCGAAAVTCSGGVSSNLSLREELAGRAEAEGVEVAFPDKEYCGDNAAMIAWTGMKRSARGETAPLDMDAEPTFESFP